ncbi:MAG: hypothetical protein KME29_08335 [Calothrix sp. FI2-JRJ7]|jgi:hypothetical protein|nr:hypothetical protein [Calothrix sp. FI2-JRJ7]
MSFLKTPKAIPSRVRGIFRYLLAVKNQKQKRDVLEQILSPDKLLERRLSEEISKEEKVSHVMFNETLGQCVKCGLLVKEDDEIGINQNLPEPARSRESGDALLPDTLVTLLFASDNADEEDFGLACAWFLAQDIYDAPGHWEAVQTQVSNQQVGDFLRMTSNLLYDSMDNWMCYMGLAWGHKLGTKRVTVPDPTLYIRRKLKDIFNQEVGAKLLMQEFIDKLAIKCPLFETGKFRDEIEKNIGQRQPNYLSTSTAFALFRLRAEGYIEMKRESDADIMILPKANNQVDDAGRISHIIWQGNKS